MADATFILIGVFILTFHITLNNALVIFPAVVGWMLIYIYAARMLRSEEIWNTLKVLGLGATVLTAVLELMRFYGGCAELQNIGWIGAQIIEFCFFYYFLKKYVKDGLLKNTDVKWYILAMMIGISLQVLTNPLGSIVALPATIMTLAARICLMTYLWNIAKQTKK